MTCQDIEYTFECPKIKIFTPMSICPSLIKHQLGKLKHVHKTVHWGSETLRLIPTSKQEISSVPCPPGVSYASCDSHFAFSVYRDPRTKSMERSSHLNNLSLTSTPEASRADFRLMRRWLGFLNQESPPTWVRASLPSEIWSWQKQ